MELDQMQDILDDLCARESCRLDQPGNDTPGMMYVEFGYVEGPRIVDTRTFRNPNAQCRYLVCLHEIGHFHWGHTQGRPWVTDAQDYGEKADRTYWEGYWDDDKAYFNNGVLYSEAQAWNYALDKCQIPSDEILPETRSFMWDTCLGSYFRGAQAAGFETPGQMLYNGDRHHVKFAYGKPGPYFYQTKRRIIEGDIEDEVDKRVKKVPEYQPTTPSVDWNSITQQTTNNDYTVQWFTTNTTGY